MKTNLYVLGSSLLVSLLIGELVARAFLTAPLSWYYPQLRYRADPKETFVLAPHQRAFTADMPVVINERGLRGPLVPYNRVRGQTRLLFLGDSIIFGYGVRESEAVPERVRSVLQHDGSRIEVVNTGVPAYNTDQEVTFLEDEGLRYDPDWVIVGMCWNDLSDKAGVRVSAEGWLISEGAPEPGPWSRLLESPSAYTLRNLLKRSRIAYAALEGVRGLKERLSPSPEARYRLDVLQGVDSMNIHAGWNNIEHAIRRIATLRRTYHFQVLIAAFPIPAALDYRYPSSSFPAHLRTIAEAERLGFLDLTPIFQDRYRGHESLFLPYDGDHPNAAGHDLAARAIAAFLENEPGSSRN